MTTSRVLIVDTPASGLWSAAARLRLDNLDVVEVQTTAHALTEIGRGVGVLVVHRAAPVDLPAILARARGLDPDLALIAITDGADDGAVPAALAAAELMQLPGDMARLRRVVAREAAGARLRHRLLAFQRTAAPRVGVEALIGESESMARVRTVIRKMTGVPAVPALICGEWGTGHGLVARILHETSVRGGEPCIRVDCTYRHTLPAELLGVGEGAGGGVLEAASEGTVYLEHVERLTPALQSSLLRVLEDGVVVRSGGTFERLTGVRVVASTTGDLDAEVEAKRFRRDLYYRLNVARLDLPPLRRRGDDAIRLADHFARIDGVAIRQRAARLDEEASTLLMRYQWPGNVRELRQVMTRASLLTTDDTITPALLAPIDPAAHAPFRLPERGINIDALERQLVIEALERTGGNQTHAAELLGLHRDQIRYRMLKYGLRR